MRGYRLYYRTGEGPMLIRFYGPAASMAYVPAALATTPTAAVFIGVLINLLLFILPGIWLIHRCRAKDQRRFLFFCIIALFAIIAARNPMLSYVARMVSTDAPAMALATCACAVLIAANSPMRSGVLCGILAALAIWSKQTLCPLIGVLILYAMLSQGFRWSLRFAGAMLGVVIVISSVVIVWFGPRELLFNMITLPSARPWQSPWLSPTRAILRALWWIWRDAQPIQWIVLVAILLRWGFSTKGDGGFSAWVRQNPWLLPLMLAILILPLCAYSYAQFGGRSNVAAPVGYLGLLAGAIALMNAWETKTDEQTLDKTQRALRLTIATVLFAAIFIFPRELSKIPRDLGSWTQIALNHNEQAYDYARAHPFQTYFPQQPLATLLAEGKLYHFDDAILHMRFAGMTMRPAQLEAGLPSDLQRIAFPDRPVETILQPLMPDFDFEHAAQTEPQLPGWFIVKRRRAEAP
jgi:hypothetical protein